MKSQEFRTTMIEKIRAFDAWAWKDELDNPGDYEGNYEFQEWFELFEQWMQND